MRTSLELQRSLYLAQQRQISKTVAKASASFRAYQRSYQRASTDYRRIISEAEVASRVSQSDVIFVGDYHTLKQAQAGYLQVVRAALHTGRKVVLALEHFESKHQRAVSAFATGHLKESTLRERTGHRQVGPINLWEHVRPILMLAREQRLEVLAIDRRAQGAQSLATRDAHAASLIARRAGADDRPVVVVLMGQFHVAPGHLPAQVAVRAPAARRLVVFQNAEGVYWRLAERGHAGSCRAVELSDEVVCLVSASPTVCQRSFLDYVEAEAGDALVDEAGVRGGFARIARVVGRLAGVPVKDALKAVEVATAATPEVLTRAVRKARLSRAELKDLQRHVLTRESAWIPRAHLAWLGSLSLNHVAEEASHFVRHVAIGDAMDAPRPRAQAFWARCVEEAIGYFGSKLVNPARRCVDLESWAHRFHHGEPHERRVGAFVLAVSAAEGEAEATVQRLLPLGDTKLMLDVSHALGYLLGEALFRAFEAGGLSPHEVRAMFLDPLERPWAAYRALCHRVALQGASLRAA